MEKLKIYEKTINFPEEITYGVRLGKDRGNSTITDFYIQSDSMEEQDIQFRIYGSLERIALAKIFKELSQKLQNEK